ncbi:MAG: hypothetical protein WD314_03310 [Trueperaceae bacterium]
MKLLIALVSLASTMALASASVSLDGAGGARQVIAAEADSRVRPQNFGALEDRTFFIREVQARAGVHYSIATVEAASDRHYFIETPFQRESRRQYAAPAR